MLRIKTETGPKLTAGAFDVAFDEFETVKEAAVSFDNPAAEGKVFATDVAISGNIATVTVKKLDVTGIPPVPEAESKGKGKGKAEPEPAAEAEPEPVAEAEPEPAKAWAWANAKTADVADMKFTVIADGE
ncbi:unnamed protein product [marine sediment metagenome]|uniref:Uncharacterized protein n=1 Tax=marine sediment metagenome TaxID=412755 RepID=X1QNV1_9ZZZZ